MTGGDVSLLLVHGDDSFGIAQALARFAASSGALEREEIVAERTPDEAAIDAARVAAASVGLFGPRLAVLRRPLRAAGRSNAAADRLVALVTQLPPGAALALAEQRTSREAGKPSALLRKLADAVKGRGGEVLERNAPRRNELTGWIQRHARDVGIEIQPRAAALLAQRIGGAVWESDIERGEQTRVADSELRKLALHADDRAVAVEDVELLTAETRPASVFAITNAIDRREAAAAADALRRALDAGEPALRILASVAGRVADLLVVRDLVASGASPTEVARRVARGNAGMAGRLAEAARRYRSEELEAMLLGLLEIDVAIKTNQIDEESALVGWLGEYLLGSRAARPTRASA